ncbi:MAG: hypothetical protein GX234_08935 [Clostridiales bacterium]|nr:hypothetical protein [Clostridiales bacterium]
MESKEKDSDNVLAFDTLFTTNSIQIMKILLPCLPTRLQNFLAVYIKYLELQYTMQFLKTHPMSPGGRQSENTVQDIQSVYPQLQGYLTPSSKTQFEQFFGMLQTMQEMKGMMDMMNMMNSFSGEDNDFSTSMDFLKGMLSPEQQAIFEMFSSDT